MDPLDIELHQVNMIETGPGPPPGNKIATQVINDADVNVLLQERGQEPPGVYRILQFSDQVRNLSSSARIIYIKYVPGREGQPGWKQK